MIIRNISYSFLALLIASCSSSSKEDSQQAKNAPKAAKVVQVEQINKADLKRQGITDKEIEKSIRGSGFATKKKWFKIQEDYKEFNELRSKDISELKRLLNQADSQRATLIIEALSHKGPRAVEVLINKLGDKRTAKFEGDDKIYWYEEKNKPPQEIELRIFAAMHLEKMVNTSPYGVTFDFHQIRTDIGPVEVLYATKGAFAVTKDDVCKTWLKWWANYGGDYR